MSKYNEIMDNIVVTDEMRSRILQNIDNELSKDDDDTHEVIDFSAKKRFRQYAGLIAAAAVLFVGAFSTVTYLNRSGNSSMSQSVTTLSQADTQAGNAETATEESAEESAQAVWNVKEFASAQELSEAAGFTISDIESLAGGAQDKSYILFEDGIAQIQYDTDSVRYTYRLREGSVSDPVEITGDYNTYAQDKTVSIAGTDVTLKGNDDLYGNAIWSADGKTGALIVDTPVAEEIMKLIVTELIK